MPRREAAEEREAARCAALLAPPPKQAPRKAPQAQDREKTEQEKQKTRDWILQYAQEDTDSEDGSPKVETPWDCHMNAAAHPREHRR